MERALLRWASLYDVRLVFVEPGRSTQLGHIESFNGRFRDEALNAYWFGSIEGARLIIENWGNKFNSYRPHSGLGGRTPKQVTNEFKLVLDTMASGWRLKSTSVIFGQQQPE